MRPDEVKALYDASYAASYDARFLAGTFTMAHAELDRQALDALVPRARRWLDVACGTGYHLSRFPHIDRVGTDISPAMLAEARRRCPGVEFVEHDFRVPRPEWDSAFDLVTSTWYAYTLVDTIADACRVFDNLAAWTRPEGTCFVPLADPRLIARSDLPYEIDDNFEGETTLTGILWSYSEDDGSKVHSHMVVPMIELVVERFGVWFEEVDVHYPEHPGRPELTARGRRSL